MKSPVDKRRPVAVEPSFPFTLTLWLGEREQPPPGRCLVLRFINTTTFAARDFWPRRDASDAHTLHGSVRSEQQSLGRKAPPPGGLRRFSVLASLLLGHSPTSGDAPSSRLARAENRRNKRGRIYEMEYLVEKARLTRPFLSPMARVAGSAGQILYSPGGTSVQFWILDS